MPDIEVDLVNLSRAITSFVDEHDQPSRTVVVNEVAVDTEQSTDAVAAALDELERTGEVYIVDGEVRLP